MYYITMGSELAWVALEVNSFGQTFSGKTIMLENDINLSSHNWVPIGNNGNNYTFQGTFDGNNKAISGLTIGTPGSPDSTIGGDIGLLGETSGKRDYKFLIFQQIFPGVQLIGNLVEKVFAGRN